MHGKVIMKRIALCAVFFAASTIDMFACSCLTVGENTEPIPVGEILFRGKVVATELVAVGDDGNMFLASVQSRTARLYRVAILEVSEKLRGDIPPFVIIATGSGGGDCGYSFQPGKSYLVDGEWTEDKTLARLGGGTRAATTSICTLTAPEEQSVGLLARLRKRYQSTSPLFVK